MGYYSHVTGELIARPKFDEADLKKVGIHIDEDGLDLVGSSRGEDDTVGILPSGEIGVIPGDSWTSIICRWDESYKAYDLDQNVRQVADYAKNTGVEINGALYVVGEDGDRYRIRVEKNQVIPEKPKLLWPNGDQEDL